MGDSPTIPAELPDDYKQLQALAAEHDIKAVGVKKADLVKALEAKRGAVAEPEAEAEDVPDQPPETPSADAAPPETAPPAATGDGVAIERQTRSAWWCPLCDHSHIHDIDTCQNCGAVRDGDTVVA